MIAIAYLGLIIFIVFLEIARKKTSKFDFLTFLNLIFILSCALPAFFFTSGILKIQNSYFAFDINNVSTHLAVFLGYLCIILGFFSRSAQRQGNKIIIQCSDDSSLFKYAIFILIFSFISLQIYGAQYGGLTQAISQSILIRSSLVEGGVFVFFKHFTLLSYFASYLLGSLIFFNKNKPKSIWSYITFLISVTTSLITASVIAGRQHLIIYFLIFYLVNILVSKKIPWGATIGLIFPAVFLILYGKILFFSLTSIQDGFDAFINTFQGAVQIEAEDSSSSNFSLITLIDTFAYPLYSIDTALHHKYQIRLFIDFFYSVLTFLPERLLNIKVPETISYYNTQFIAGINDFTIQPGLIAFGIYSMSWAGIIIVCLIYGWLGRYLQTILNKNLYSSSWMPFIYVLTAQMWIDFYSFGDPRVFLFGDFWALIGITSLFSILTKVSILQDH